MGIIRLKNMQFHGFHGVHDFEKEKGATFEVDVEMKADLSTPCETDDVSNTIDYDAVFKQVEHHVTRERFDLIEALADSIARSLMNDHDLETATVRVRKPEAPIEGTLDTVEVEITRSKSND